MKPTSTSGISIVVAAALCFAGIGATVAAESAPDSENGRYTFSTSPDGMVRLDTRTGTVSNCNNSASGWACYAVPDERKALDEEIGRLQTENERLKTQLAASGKTYVKHAGSTAENQRKIEIPLPSDQDMDRVMSFLQRAWKRLVDMANQMQKDVARDGKI